MNRFHANRHTLPGCNEPARPPAYLHGLCHVAVQVPETALML